MVFRGKRGGSVVIGILQIPMGRFLQPPPPFFPGVKNCNWSLKILRLPKNNNTCGFDKNTCNLNVNKVHVFKYSFLSFTIIHLFHKYQMKLNSSPKPVFFVCRIANLLNLSFIILKL